MQSSTIGFLRNEIGRRKYHTINTYIHAAQQHFQKGLGERDYLPSPPYTKRHPFSKPSKTLLHVHSCASLPPGVHGQIEPLNMGPDCAALYNRHWLRRGKGVAWGLTHSFFRCQIFAKPAMTRRNAFFSLQACPGGGGTGRGGLTRRNDHPNHIIHSWRATSSMHHRPPLLAASDQARKS